MDVLLANDTSGTSNPGCQGTVFWLVDSLRFSGCNIESRLPVKYAYESFGPPPPPAPAALATRASRRLQRSLRKISIRGQEASPGAESARSLLAASQWRETVDVLARQLAPLWERFDTLVVNGEGTIHHASIGARTLTGLCAAAKQIGLRVALVNCSIFELDEWLLEALAENVDDLAVREPLSQQYLRSKNLNARLSADCLFLACDQPSETSSFSHRLSASGEPYAVYTPGVLSGSHLIPDEVVAADIRQLTRKGWKVFYYVVEIEDEPLAAVAIEHGAQVIPLGGLNWSEVTAFLRHAEMVVSGRYHINIFAALASTPFIPMESNTPKMAGLLNHLGFAADYPIRKWGADARALLPLDLDTAVKVNRETLDNCVELARGAFSDVTLKTHA